MHLTDKGYIQSSIEVPQLGVPDMVLDIGEDSIMDLRVRTVRMIPQTVLLRSVQKVNGKKFYFKVEN